MRKLFFKRYLSKYYSFSGDFSLASLHRNDTFLVSHITNQCTTLKAF